jgi:hypothetical protein
MTPAARLINPVRLIFLVTSAFLLYCKPVQAQHLLDKRINVHLTNIRLADALTGIGNNGGFYFSYNGNLFRKDSLVTITVQDKPLAYVLSQLFHNRFDYEERKNYLIITPALAHLAMINTDVTAENNAYSISGIVVDDNTGERLMNASVYETQQLVSTLTDEHGYFRLKFRNNDQGPVSITAAKLLYKDTSVTFLETVSVKSRANKSRYANTATKGNRVERTGLGRMFISARQKIQSLNIPDFFATRPFQISLTPGLSTHGMFSPQVVNKFSLNLIGGYTAGVNGLEIGGLFNIDKMNARYLQLAGVFNLAGGNATGLQLAGAHNRALDTVKGVQLALFTNNAGEQLSGVQISALHNQTHRLKGLQVGLVNVADTSQGASIGLLNIIGNGFYKVTYSASDMSNTNISLKTGTHSFYSELLTSANISADQKFYSFGLGIGHDFMFSNTVYVSAEANYQFANTGLWDDRWTQGKLLLNVQLSKNISLVGGPTFNHYNHSGNLHIAGYKNITNLPDYGDITRTDYTQGGPYYGDQSKNWIGLEVGISFNSVFKPAKRAIDNSQNWYLGFAATGGIGWDQPYGIVSGGELSVQRDLGDNLTGTLSSGYTHFGIQRRYIFNGSGNVDDYSLPVNMVPIKAGIRLKTSKNFFISGEIGEAFGSETYLTGSPYVPNETITTPYHSLMYAVSAGFSFNSGLETGIKFEDYGLQSQYKQFALRLGYRLKLSK